MGGFPEWEDREASIAPLEFNGIPWISTMELVGLEGGDSRNRRVSEHSGMEKLEMGVATRTRVPLGLVDPHPDEDPQGPGVPGGGGLRKTPKCGVRTGSG